MAFNYLNIGLISSKTGQMISSTQLAQIVSLLANRADGIMSLDVIQPSIETRNVEPTLVVSVLGNFARSTAHAICEIGEQDCIALWTGHKGELIGPRAKDWGNFNPELFIIIQSRVDDKLVYRTMSPLLPHFITPSI